MWFKLLVTKSRPHLSFTAGRVCHENSKALFSLMYLPPKQSVRDLVLVAVDVMILPYEGACLKREAGIIFSSSPLFCLHGSYGCLLALERTVFVVDR